MSFPATLFAGLGRLIGLVRRFLRGLLPVAAIAAVGFGAYLLFFREQEQQVGYTYANLIGGEGGSVSCVFSDSKPRVRISKPPQGAGGAPKTSIAFAGSAGLAFAESCDGAEPQLRLRSLSMVLPGVIPVNSDRMEAKAKAKGKGKGSGSQQRKGSGGKQGKDKKSGKS